MAEHGILPIDACVVNLYPFEETVNSGADFGTCVENIDVGGPAMIRAAAKNFKSVTVVTEVDQYAELLTELAENDGCTSLALREKYAGAAYARTAVYDAKIASWFSMQGEDHFPERLVISGTLKQRLRYGENPHQVRLPLLHNVLARTRHATEEYHDLIPWLLGQIVILFLCPLTEGCLLRLGWSKETWGCDFGDYSGKGAKLQ
mmetsp:Transcript_8073/g.35889  ORF Transcript_8073/g.35889 Transcript_8073/m.35889 type:complete len:204 (-) Transcript_8073:1224-1835(-)